jgi:hypothetical protein
MRGRFFRRGLLQCIYKELHRYIILATQHLASLEHPVSVGNVLPNKFLELACHESFVVEEASKPFLPYVPCRVDEFCRSVFSSRPARLA